MPLQSPNPDVQTLSQADLDLQSAVYVCLVSFSCLAAVGVYYTKINTSGSIIPFYSSRAGTGFKLSDLTLNPSVILSGSNGSDVEKNFKKIYLIAFLLAMLSDWLQGPYVYALYQSYGFSHADNGLLFVFGFGSSMLFGTFIGGYADKYGRKQFAILYCVIYALSCCTKHFNSFIILSFGRILAGIATSLLYSVFETWLVCESSQRGVSDALLGEIFSTAIFGNSLVAIFAGFIAQAVSDIIDFQQVTSIMWVGKYCSPFDLAIVVLSICGIYIYFNWNENYGKSQSQRVNNSNSMTVVPVSVKDVVKESNSTAKKSTTGGPGPNVTVTDDNDPIHSDSNNSSTTEGSDISSSNSAGTTYESGAGAVPTHIDSDSSDNYDHNEFYQAYSLLKSDKKLLCLGFMSSFFESSMFLFVFLWTPAITADKTITQAPFGLIFSIFMIGVMVGSCLFSLLTTSRTTIDDSSGTVILTNRTVFGFPPLSVHHCAFIVFGLSCISHFLVVLSNSPLTIILAFTIFEVCVGCYFPCIGMIKSKVVPENCRSTMYNFFRIPLNLIVVIALLVNFSVKMGFLITTILLGTSCYLLLELGSDWQGQGQGLKGSSTQSEENENTRILDPKYSVETSEV